MTRNQVMEFSHGAVAIFTKENTKMIVETDTDKCTGLTVVITKANGRMVFNMEWVRYLFLKKVLKEDYSRTTC
jgi:hypothetical protein